jgi:hypothetical protein
LCYQHFIHACSEIIFGKIFFCSSSLCFLAFLCEASGRLFYMSGRCDRTFQYQVWTHALVLVSYVAHYVRTDLVLRLNGEPLRVKSLSPLRRMILITFSFIFCRLCDFFLAFHMLFSCALVILRFLSTPSLPFFLSLSSFYA